MDFRGPRGLFTLGRAGFPVWNPNKGTWQNGKSQPATPIEAFARSQAGLFSSEDLSRISYNPLDFHRFSRFH